LTGPQTYCHPKSTDLKEQRLQIRIDAAAKRRLELAAATSGLTVSSFVLHAAEARAHELLANSGLLQLSQVPALPHEALQPFPTPNECPAHAPRAPKKHPKKHPKKDAKRSKRKDKKKQLP
jgi:uncharacterized protein (DUF1778 family)